MYRVKQPAQDLDFRFSVQMPKIPLHILHLNTPSSGRMGKCDGRIPEDLRNLPRKLDREQSFCEFRLLPVHPHPRSHVSYPAGLLPK